MSTVKSTSYFKFENMNDYVNGLAGLTETLHEWTKRSDKGFERKFNISEFNDEYKVQIELEVSQHEPNSPTI